MAKFAVGYEVRDGQVSMIRVDIHTGRVVESADEAEVVGIGVADDGSVDLDLPGGVPVARFRRDYATVAGAGVASPSTMVLDIASGLHLMNSRVAADVPGIVTVPGGFLPGYVGYEIALPPLAIDADRAAIEAAAFRLADRCDALRAAGVHVRRFVAIGAAAQSAQIMQVFSDVLAEKITLAASDRPAALGAAILGCLAAGPAVTGYAAMSQAVQAMAHQREDIVYRPDIDARRLYARLRNGPIPPASQP